MALVSGFGKQGEVTGTRFFVMRHKFLLCTHFFEMRHRNIVMRWCITKKTGALQKTGGSIMKKRVHNKKTGTRNLPLFHETRNKNLR